MKLSKKRQLESRIASSLEAIVADFENEEISQQEAASELNAVADMVSALEDDGYDVVITPDLMSRLSQMTQEEDKEGQEEDEEKEKEARRLRRKARNLLKGQDKEDEEKESRRRATISRYARKNLRRRFTR